MNLTTAKAEAASPRWNNLEFPVIARNAFLGEWEVADSPEALGKLHANWAPYQTEAVQMDRLWTLRVTIAREVEAREVSHFRAMPAVEVSESCAGYWDERFQAESESGLWLTVAEWMLDDDAYRIEDRESLRAGIADAFDPNAPTAMLDDILALETLERHRCDE